MVGLGQVGWYLILHIRIHCIITVEDQRRESGLASGGAVSIFAISRRFDRALIARPNIFVLDSVCVSLVNYGGVGGRQSQSAVGGRQRQSAFDVGY